jgi:predicted  nucleic acid-binding Zn-ribbon protein
MSEIKSQPEEQKLKLLFQLQRIDSKIDEINTLRGELPLQVKDLEDEMIGLETRTTKIKEEVDNLAQAVSDRKNQIIEAEEKIKKYEKQQMTVKNNREFDSLNKEIEFQKLEIELSEKRIKEYKDKTKEEKDRIKEIKEVIKEKKADLKDKKKELDEIKNETKIEEENLIKKSEEIKNSIEERLVKAYTRIRSNVRNGLAVAPVDRGACGGCHNKIPPQRQLDIATRKKIIVCEHCGRILVDPMLADEHILILNKPENYT